MSITGATRAAAVLIGFALVTVLARLCGPTAFGLYAFATSIAAILAMLANLGCNKLIVREVADSVERDRIGSLRGLLIFWSTLTLAVSAALVVIGLVVPSGDEATGQAWRLGLFLVPLMGLLTIARATLEGLHRVALAQVAEALVVPIVILLAILGLYASGSRLLSNDLIAVWASIFAHAVALGLAMAVVAMRIPILSTSATRLHVRAWLMSSVPLLLSGGMFLINSRTDVIMLGWLGSADDAGIYAAAARIAQLVTLPLFAANTVMGPRLAALIARGEEAAAQGMLTTSARLATASGFGLAVVLIAVAPWVLGIFGAEFERGLWATVALCLAQAISSLAGTAFVVLVIMRREGLATAGVSVGVVVNITLNLWLIPVLGVTGAAVAAGVSLLAWSAILIGISWRYTRFDPTAFGRALSRTELS